MIELLCAVDVGLIFGYLLKKDNQPPAVEILTNQVEHLEKEVAYYKDLCKWHVERNKHE
jgi:hypothetical protein